jgi:hypothetical protein
MSHRTKLQRDLLISLLVLLGTSQVGIVFAGLNVWTSNGPENGDVLALAVDPVTPTTLYAGTQNSGVSKSTNRGGNWSAADTGLEVSACTP